MAVRQAKYLADRLRGRTEERFNYEIKAQVLSLGVDDHILLLENSMLTESLARLVEEFSKDLYRKIVEGEGFGARPYGRGFLSQVLAGVTFAGFAFSKVIGKAQD